ncbi:hypothetical protein D3C71_814130 [compost metagenome]
MVTVLPASALPESVGDGSSVTPPLTNAPCLAPTSSAAASMLGAVGGTVSTVKLNGLVGSLVLPALSVAVTVMLCAPSDRAVPGVKLHEPSGLTVVSPSRVAPSYTLMVLPALPVPWISGRASSVFPLGAMAPWMVPWSSISLPRVTTPGMASTTTFSASPCPLLLPAWSTTSVVKACSPLVSGVVGVKLQSPFSSTSASPILVPLSYTFTVAPGSALPLKVGRSSSVVSPSFSAPTLPPTSSVTTRSVTCPGGVASTTKFQTPVASLVWPTGLVAVAVMLCVPSARLASGVKLHLPLASATVWPSSFVPS